MAPQRLFVHVEHLPEQCLPAQVFRRGQLSLLWADPAMSVAEVAWWSQSHLTVDERVVLREAFEMDPDLTTPPDDAKLDGLVADLALPPCLRLPGNQLTRAV